MKHPPIKSPAKLLHEAKNAAGEQARLCGERDEWPKAREWQNIAVDINTLMTRSVKLMAKS